MHILNRLRRVMLDDGQTKETAIIAFYITIRNLLSDCCLNNESSYKNWVSSLFFSRHFIFIRFHVGSTRHHQYKVNWYHASLNVPWCDSPALQWMVFYSTICCSSRQTASSHHRHSSNPLSSRLFATFLQTKNAFSHGRESAAATIGFLAPVTAANNA